MESGTPAAGPSQAASEFRSVTVVVPTYREVESIPHLIRRLAVLREQSGLDLDLLLMDDDSKDGSVELVESLGLPWANMVVRHHDRGLSQAVLDGLRSANRPCVVVMDADLSHPPEKIPEMLLALEHGADLVVGSRFTPGGSTADDWGVVRWLNSRVATLLAMPLAKLKDPMSGFFAMRRATFLSGHDLNPVGYKIGLELLIKCDCKKVIEVPIHFSDRRHGKSKLTLREQLKYLQHLRRLYIHKYGNWSHLAQFLVVGASGLVVNLVLLTAFLAIRLDGKLAIGFAIALSMCWNFVLNRRFSFSYARQGNVLRQFVGFIAASSIGAVVNYMTTLALWEAFQVKQLAAVVGVVAGTALNFLGSRFIVFRREHIRPDR